MKEFYIYLKERHMKSICPMIFVIIMMQNVATNLFSQSSSAVTAKSVLTREIKEDGWSMKEMRISRISEASVKGSREVTTKEEIKVTETSFEPGEDRILENFGGTVSSIKRYGINNRPFCYLVSVQPHGFDRLEEYAYYDEVGDGIFRVKEKFLEQPSRISLNFLRLPKWVEQEAAKNHK
jgi:hypothetical protein